MPVPSGMRRATYQKLQHEEALRVRIKAIIQTEGLYQVRMGEALGFKPPEAIHRWICNTNTIGPETIQRVEEWLAKWDAAEVDLEPLKLNACAESEDENQVLRNRVTGLAEREGLVLVKIGIVLGLSRHMTYQWMKGHSRLGRDRRKAVATLIDRLEAHEIDLGPLRRRQVDKPKTDTKVTA